ncbi:MAG: hypothetical protein DRP16_04980, partial [Candidatus Aenigmatarchaeota archaeon]
NLYIVLNYKTLDTKEIIDCLKNGNFFIKVNHFKISDITIKTKIIIFLFKLYFNTIKMIRKLLY